MRDGSKTFGLAPMEGVSELPFRLWIAQVSNPTFSSTPFLRATDTYPSELPIDFAPEILRDWNVPYALIPQVMASDPADFVRTARLLLPAADFVDLNCGCPSPNPVSGGAGSSLLKDTGHFLNFARTLARSLPSQSFSIKMRTGFHDIEAFSAMTDGLQEIPLRQLTVHGRTRSDRYDGWSRWDLIQSAAERLSCPVVGSGDILGYASWQSIQREAPAIERFIVGRGALRNPWIFEELRRGTPVVIRRSLLQKALACFGLLTELGLDHQIERLEPLVQQNLWARSAGTDSEVWQDLYERLTAALLGTTVAYGELPLNRISLGRVKMLWNYVRSSLPDPYFEPLLLRAKSIGELLDGLTAIDPDDAPFAIAHRPDWDWLYTSSRRKPASEMTSASL